MGQSSSSILPSADPKVPYFSLTFQTPDKIILSLADKSIITLTRSAILESSSNASATAKSDNEADSFLHYEGLTDMNSYMFKFRGLPFMRGCGRANSFRSTRMCCKMLEKYYQHGWRLLLSSDLSRAKQLTTWFFHRVENPEEGARNEKQNRPTVICISNSCSDLIRLANAPEAARRLLSQAVRATYAGNGIKSESVYGEADYEIQLTESPWLNQDAPACVGARRLILEIIRRLEVVGFKFFTTANTKGTSDSLFFISTQNEPIESPGTPTSVLFPKFTTTATNGNNVSNGGCSYCAISLNYSNCLRVIDGPPCVIKGLLRAIVRYWPPKLKHLTTLDDRGAYEFILRGNPWLGTKGEEATAARILLCGLLETMENMGWEPLTALDVTRRHNDKAVFVFRRSSDASKSRSKQLDNHEDRGQLSFFLDECNAVPPYWCLSMHEQSTIRLIGAPQYLRQNLRHTIDQIWPWGVQAEFELSKANEGYEFKLRGGPWGAEQQNTTALMCYILKTLNDQGYRAVLSADVTGRFVLNNHGGSHSLDVHSWFVTPIASKTEKESIKTPNGLSAMPQVMQKRRSMPFLTRSATSTDDVLIMSEFVERVVGAPLTPPQKQASVHKRALKKGKERVLRKISTISEYSSRATNDKI